MSQAQTGQQLNALLMCLTGQMRVGCETKHLNGRSEKNGALALVGMLYIDFRSTGSTVLGEKEL